MMKKYLLILFLSIVSLSGFAQFNLYHPFPDSNAWWSDTHGGAYLCPPNYTTYSPVAVTETYNLRGDTIINKLKYSILSEVFRDYCNGPTGELTYYATVGYIREDTLKHVYIRGFNGIKNDSLLYDFNLKLGDTLPPLFITASDMEPYVVSSIDSLLVGTLYRKQFIIKYKAISGGNYLYDSITEGIGSWHGLLGEINCCPDANPPGQLNCFKHNNDSIIGKNCEFLYVGVNDLQTKQIQFTLFPNPTGTNVTLSYQLPLNESKGILRLYNTMGQLIKTSNISSGNGTIEEDISALPTGVYYYTLSLEGVVMATNKLAIIR